MFLNTDSCWGSLTCLWRWAFKQADLLHSQQGDTLEKHTVWTWVSWQCFTVIQITAHKSDLSSWVCLMEMTCQSIQSNSWIAVQCWTMQHIQTQTCPAKQRPTSFLIVLRPWTFNCLLHYHFISRHPSIGGICFVEGFEWMNRDGRINLGWRHLIPNYQKLQKWESGEAPRGTEVCLRMSQLEGDLLSKEE